jgi:hypothetical protein
LSLGAGRITRASSWDDDDGNDDEKEQRSASSGQYFARLDLLPASPPPMREMLAMRARIRPLEITNPGAYPRALRGL